MEKQDIVAERDYSGETCVHHGGIEMRLILEKNKALDLDTLKKIDQADAAIAKSEADSLYIDQDTVYAHISKLIADAGGGFDKTSIELKNIFESAPISRSQAKRLSNRLDIFKEIELDFAGIDWMGQGFAHQIFVVFQNEHPDITIRPVNMCEEVKKMYVHVMS